jgi:hypothetical protein
LPKRSGQSHEPALYRTCTLKTAGGTVRRTALPIYEVHAKGHFRRTLYPLKMLLSGHLVGKEFILTDQKTAPARFFLFGEGKHFFGNRKILP